MIFPEQRDLASSMEGGVGSWGQGSDREPGGTVASYAGAGLDSQRGQRAEALLPPRPLTEEDDTSGRPAVRPSGWPPEIDRRPPVEEEAATEEASPRMELELEQRVMLNVGGVRHETRLSTLRAIPNTRLSRLAHTHAQLALASPCPTPTTPSVSPVSPVTPPTEYFFDRHPSVFNAVIDFYRTGELHVPLEVCGAVVKRELDFWQIDEMEIKACCWRHYRSYIENQAILDSFNQSLQRECHNVDLDKLQGWSKLQMRVWLILDHPRTSRAAMTYGIVSFLFVVTSIAGFCLETLPDLRPEVGYNKTAICRGTEQTISVMTSNPVLNALDVVCTVFFTLELIVRCVFAPNKWRFVLSPMNVIDLLALVPLYVQIIFHTSDLLICYMNERFVIEIMFILRIFRMFRIFHLVKHYQALKVLVYAMRASLQELLMLFIFLLIAMLVFATMIYYAEQQNATLPSNQFSTIPMGFWWAIITMTTVGYGDVAPVTPVGYVVGTACCVVGVLLVALTFPVISNNFTLFYQHVRSRPIHRDLGVREKGGGGGGRGGGGCLQDDEEERLLYTPTSSPSHADPRKTSWTSVRVSPYMNGGTVHHRSPAAAVARGTPSRDGRRAEPAMTPTPRAHKLTLAKFSDSNSMTDIILRSPTETEIIAQQKQLQFLPDPDSPASRKAHSDDGMPYHGETKL